MMTEEEFELEQKDCADMLGMTIEEYDRFLEDKTIPEFDDEEEESDESVLKRLGIENVTLKKKDGAVKVIAESK